MDKNSRGPGSLKDAVTRSSPRPAGSPRDVASYERRLMEHMRLAEKSIDYTMILALFSIAVVSSISFLQGFRVYGFYMDPAAFAALVTSMSVVPALRAFAATGGRASPES